jgi:hypothetical protein
LPKIKCNDYLNSFLQTFNLRLTQRDKNTYSIDYTRAGQEAGGIIDIDQYVHVSSAKYRRLDLPSTINLKFKISKEEEGYVTGNDRGDQSLVWNHPGYDGSATFTNPANTAGEVVNRESLWSYCWYKTISYKNGYVDNPAGTFDAPVITDPKIWQPSYTYETAKNEGFYTDKTMRFFYLWKDPILLLYKHFTFVNETDWLVRLLWVRNFTVTLADAPDGSIEERLFMLDYNPDDELKRQNIKNITSAFFDIRMSNSYQVDLPVILPNHMFKKLKASTLVKFNDGIYRLKMIEGHAVAEDGEATLSLLSM